MKRNDRPAVALALLFVFTGVAHFVSAEQFRKIVPPVVGDARFWVTASGVAELAVAALLLPRSTRRVAGLVAAILLILVFPANVYMAIKRDLFDLPTWITWARLPLQIPLIWWAIHVWRSEQER